MAKGVPNQIGELNIGVGINPAAMAPGLKAAEAQAAAGGAKIGAAIDQGVKAGTATTAATISQAVTGGTAGGGLSGATAAIRGATDGVRKFMSAIIGTFGIATRFLGLIGLITGALVALGAGLAAGWRALVQWGEAAEVAGFKLRDPLIKELERLKKMDPIKLPINFDQLDEDVKSLPELSKAVEVAQKKFDQMGAQRGVPGGGKYKEALDKAIKEEKDARDRINAAIERGNALAKEEQATAKATADAIQAVVSVASPLSVVIGKYLKDLIEVEAKWQNIQRLSELHAGDIFDIRIAEEKAQREKFAQEGVQRAQEARDRAREIAKAVGDAVRDATKETLSEMRDLLKAQVASTRQVENVSRSIRNGQYRGGDR